MAKMIEARNPTSPCFDDYFSLLLTYLSKIGRNRLACSARENQAKFYEHFFLDNDLRVAKLDQRRIVRQSTLNGCLVRALKPGSTILDAGCGFGELLDGIPSGFRLFGIDLAESNVKSAWSLLKERAEVKQASLTKIPYPNSLFDCCICLEVLEHIQEEREVLEEFHRVLAADGVLIISVPYTYYWPQYKKLIGHIRHYNRDTLSSILRQHGFEANEYLPNFPSWHREYALRYCWARFWALTVGRLMGHRDVYDFRWPWFKKLELQRIAEALEDKRLQEANLQYPQLSTSTFVVARKK